MTGIRIEQVSRAFGAVRAVREVSRAWVLLLGRSGLVYDLLRSVGIPFTSIYGRTGLVLVYTLQTAAGWC